MHSFAADISALRIEARRRVAHHPDRVRALPARPVATPGEARQHPRVATRLHSHGAHQVSRSFARARARSSWERVVQCSAVMSWSWPHCSHVLL